MADKPYIYSILDWSHPTYCVLTILGVVLILPFIHFIFIILYKYAIVLTMTLCNANISHRLRSMLIRAVNSPEAGHQDIEMVEAQQESLL